MNSRTEEEQEQRESIDYSERVEDNQYKQEESDIDTVRLMLTKPNLHSKIMSLEVGLGLRMNQAYP